MKSKILVFATVPPPFHGSNYMTKLLLESHFSTEFDVKHIDIRFSKEIKDLQKFTLKKAYLFFKYLYTLIKQLMFFKPKYIIFVPAFIRNPFIVSFFYFVIVQIVFKKNVILWLNSNNMKNLYDASNFIIKFCIKYMFDSSFRIVPAASRLITHNSYFFPKEEKIRTIHNGIPIKLIADAKKNGKIVISYISNMDRTKGWEILFYAAQEIVKNNPSVRVDFYGNPTQNSPIDKINEILESCNLNDSIIYHGPVYGDEKLRVLSGSDIFCFPTFYPTEAFPLSILEAMAYGLPVVTTDQGGIIEAIIDGEGGFIVKKEDIADLTIKLEILIKDKFLRKKMGDFNRKRFENNFSLSIFEKKWISFLNNMESDSI